nr:hypothetical protein [Planotetraspora kaengkrachanensis]
MGGFADRAVAVDLRCRGFAVVVELVEQGPHVSDSAVERLLHMGVEVGDEGVQCLDPAAHRLFVGLVRGRTLEGRTCVQRVVSQLFGACACLTEDGVRFLVGLGDGSFGGFVGEFDDPGRAVTRPGRLGTFIRFKRARPEFSVLLKDRVQGGLHQAQEHVHLGQVVAFAKAHHCEHLIAYGHRIQQPIWSWWVQGLSGRSVQCRVRGMAVSMSVAFAHDEFTDPLRYAVMAEC